MDEYCTVQVLDSWEPDIKPNDIVECVFEDANSEIVPNESIKPHSKRDHLTSQNSLSQRLQVTHRGHEDPDDIPPCQITLQCKPLRCINIAGLWVASEARNVEMYDTKDGSYLQTVRGVKDREDSEADNSRVHFLCRCQLDRPVEGVTVKFMSLGKRVSFEIAHIKVVLEACSSPKQTGGSGALSSPSIDMDRLRQDVDDMGETVSDRAKAFLTTLENFQKNKHGAVDDMRQLLMDRNAPEGMGQSMGGITTLLSMFASSAAAGRSPTSQSSDTFPTEGAMMNHMLTQMMSSLSMWPGGGEARGKGERDMFQFLQSVCSQVSQQRAGDSSAQTEHPGASQAIEQGKGRDSNTAAESSGKLESRVTAQVEAAMESRLSEVEEHIKQQVDRRMEELETRMTDKLDAIFALLQAQKQS
ncbi:ATPase PAAT-like [Babylonia areolata]|uniref:ATPase PAAT-like n=1 Tax=Babylonia areolata TaxID=304850 RepID=UPI003FD045E2